MKCSNRHKNKDFKVRNKISLSLKNYYKTVSEEDGQKTAKENMFLNDYRVIYDSGNKIFTKEHND